jgi:HEAT repeat protein
MPALVVPALVRGAGASGDACALPLLEQQLGRGGDVERIALAELARQRAPRELPAQLIEKLRELLESEQTNTSQSACAALAALGDFESVDDLVRILQGAPSGLRKSAHRALCELSGLNLPEQYSSWHAWQKQEFGWYTKRADRLGSDLIDGSERKALDALREIGLYHWERHQLSDLVASALWRKEPSVIALACETLLRLDSPRAESFLAEAAGTLDGPAAESAERARATLVQR